MCFLVVDDVHIKKIYMLVFGDIVSKGEYLIDELC